jgi:hypothetical protein
MAVNLGERKREFNYLYLLDQNPTIYVQKSRTIRRCSILEVTMVIQNQVVRIPKTNKDFKLSLPRHINISLSSTLPWETL